MLRAGRFKEQIKAVVLPARDRVENRQTQRIAAGDLRETALLTFLLAETHLHANYKLLVPTVRRGTEQLRQGLEDTGRHSGTALAWTAFALRSVRDAHIDRIDLDALVQAAAEATSRVESPQDQDLARLALALAMPEETPKDFDAQAFAKRLRPQDDEQFTLAMLALALRAHEAPFAIEIQRLLAQRARIPVAERHAEQTLALRLLADHAIQRHSRILRLDATLVIRVLDADGHPAVGYLALPTAFGGARALDDGRVELRPAPLPGLSIDYSTIDPRSDIVPLPARLKLGVLDDALGKDGFEVEFRLPR